MNDPMARRRSFLLRQAEVHIPGLSAALKDNNGPVTIVINVEDVPDALSNKQLSALGRTVKLCTLFGKTVVVTPAAVKIIQSMETTLGETQRTTDSNG
jgi:hypothetical protein